MNIAVTVWENRISPVFDSAQTLLIVQVDGNQISDRKIVNFRSGLLSQLLGLLEEMEVHLFICGALCKGPVHAIESKGIEVLPFMTGEAERVLEVLVRGEDLAKCFMPGCGSSRCCRVQNGADKRRTGFSRGDFAQKPS